MIDWKDPSGKTLKTTKVPVGEKLPLAGKNAFTFGEHHGGGSWLRFAGTFVDKIGERIVILDIGPGSALTGPTRLYKNVGKELPSSFSQDGAMFTLLAVGNGNSLEITDDYRGNYLTWQYRDAIEAGRCDKRE